MLFQLSLLIIHLLDRFPKRPEALVSSDQLEERRKALEQYLQDLLKIRAFKNHHETVSPLNLLIDLILNKRSNALIYIKYSS